MVNDCTAWTYTSVMVGIINAPGISSVPLSHEDFTKAWSEEGVVVFIL